MRIGRKIIISGRIVDVEKGICERAANVSANSINEIAEVIPNFIKKISGF